MHLRPRHHSPTHRLLEMAHSRAKHPQHSIKAKHLQRSIKAKHPQRSIKAKHPQRSIKAKHPQHSIKARHQPRRSSNNSNKEEVV
jgi:hypothetical protein